MITWGEGEQGDALATFLHSCHLQLCRTSTIHFGILESKDLGGQIPN